MLYNFVKTIQKMNFKTIFFYLCLSLIIKIVFLSDDINIESILTLLSTQNLPTLLMCYKVLKIIFTIYIAYFILYEDISTENYIFTRINKVKWYISKISATILIMLMIKIIDWLPVIISSNFEYHFLIIDLLFALIICLITHLLLILKKEPLFILLIPVLFINLGSIKVCTYAIIILILFLFNITLIKKILKQGF